MENSKVTLSQVEEAFMSATKDDNRCNLGRMLHEMEDVEAREVLGAKINDDARYAAATIVRVLKALDFPPVSSAQVTKHRRGLCRCK